MYHFLLRYPGRTIVFLSSIDGIRRLHPLLVLLGLDVMALHSGMQQRARLKYLDRSVFQTSTVLVNYSLLHIPICLDSRSQRLPFFSRQMSLLEDLIFLLSRTLSTTSYLGLLMSTSIDLDVLLVLERRVWLYSFAPQKRSKCSDCSWPVWARVSAFSLASTCLY